MYSVRNVAVFLRNLLISFHENVLNMQTEVHLKRRVPKDSNHSTIKGKVHPRINREDPDGEWRYNATFSLTLALDGGA